jgi:putative ABC transport system permease protein
MHFLKISWRNILRHKRRSILVIITISFGLAFSVFMWAILEGTWDKMVEGAVSLNTGYMQVNKQGYEESQALEYTFDDNSDIENIILANPHIVAVSKRLESAGLVSIAEDTCGASLIGIQPETEEALTSLKDKIQTGGWLSPGLSKEVLLSNGIAKSLNAKIGDEVAILTQTYYASLAAELYKVKGIFKTGNPRIDFATAFITIEDARQLMDLEGKSSRMLLWLDSIDSLPTVKNYIIEHIPIDRYEWFTWDALLPEVEQLITFNRITTNLLLFMLMVVVLTAVFNTIFTSVTERMHEFGVMFALGVKPFQITLLITLEVMILMAAGLFIGNLLGGAVSAYYTTAPITFLGQPEGLENIGFTPVFYCGLKLKNFLILSGAVMAVGIIASIYPIRIVLKSRPVEILRFI